MQQLADHPFDLGRAPLLRTAAFQLDDGGRSSNPAMVWFGGRSGWS